MVSLILAAGAGRRFGTVAKAALTRSDGSTFLSSVINTATAAGVRDHVVVVGPPHGEQTRRLAESLTARVVVNLDSALGMASSVSAGFSYLLKHSAAAGALLWPVDHPSVVPETVARLIRLLEGYDAVVPVYGGRGGHPVVVSRGLWPALANCTTAAEGARSVLRDTRTRVLRWAVDDLGVVADVDTPEDL